MRHIYLSVFTCFFIILIYFQSYSQSVSFTINYTGGMAQGGCLVCGQDYWCINNPPAPDGGKIGTSNPCWSTQFFDPVPPGNVITNVVVNYWTAGCGGAAIYGTFSNSSSNIFSVPVAYDANTGCYCDDAPCGLTYSVTSNFPCGIPGYAYGNYNYFTICANGPMCINRAQIIFSYVNVSVLTPTITASGPISICPGGSVTLTANSGYSAYHWSNGANTQAITVSPATTTTYTVSVTTSTGCTTANASITITVNPIPTVTASASPTSICSGQCTNLTGSGASSYGWIPGN
ncbi:MAG: hypothetical protein WC401_10470, partial [Bacteroidales bacterium]